MDKKSRLIQVIFKKHFNKSLSSNGFLKTLASQLCILQEEYKFFHDKQAPLKAEDQRNLPLLWSLEFYLFIAIKKTFKFGNIFKRW